MKVFIIHSSDDKNFVSKLGADLVKNEIPIWISDWEIKVGDNIVEKIEDGIRNASLAIVVVSAKSNESIWCKKEVSISLTREIQSENVFILPIRIDDVEMPIMLSDKNYADFTKGYEEELKKVILSIKTKTNTGNGRVKSFNEISEYSLNDGVYNGLYFFKVEVVNMITNPDGSGESGYINIEIEGNEAATERYMHNVANKQEYLTRYVLVDFLATFQPIEELAILTEEFFGGRKSIIMQDATSEIQFKINITTRKVGGVSGMDTIIYVRKIFEGILADIKG